MSANDSAGRFGRVAIAIHWLTAGAILLLLVLGFAAATSLDPDLKASVLRWHVPLGVVVVLLTLFRIVWWFVAPRPAPVAGPRWQHAAEITVRVLLYAAILVLGASGIVLMLLSGAAAVLFFGASEALADFRQFAPLTAHLVAAVALAVLASGHIAAALYHQFYLGDRLMARMGLGRGASDVSRTAV